MVKCVTNEIWRQWSLEILFVPFTKISIFHTTIFTSILLFIFRMETVQDWSTPVYKMVFWMYCETERSGEGKEI